MITKEELAALAGVETSPVVSIYLPTHERGREVRQDPIRMRNALAAVAERLAAAGHREPEVRELLAPAHDLAADQTFWRHQAQGLAVFVAPGLFQHHKLPVEVGEEQRVGRRPHVRPLLPLLAHDGRFYVLAAQAADLRLYLGSRHGGLAEVEADLPRSVAEVTAETDYENMRHAAPPARPRSGAPVGMPATHNFGEDPEEQRKAQLVEHLRRVHNALERHLAGDRTPIVLVAQPEVEGHLKALAKNVRFVEASVQKDPGAMREGELHERAYEIVRPLFASAREQALDRFRMLAGQGDARGATELRAVVAAAAAGRIDTLFAAEDASAWGRPDREEGKVRIDREETPENEDLVDYAAVHTMLNAGQVQVLPPAEMPREVPMCALLRY